MNPTTRAVVLWGVLLLASLSGCGSCVPDTTAPEITVTGVEEGKHYREPVTVGFSATDDHPGSVTATLDGADFA
ncbi:MAG TPA: hypothetical protein VE153_09525, partial [Myxococcus sp.]|nr:hypothetical protein [Myxococcus sp.]